VTLESAVVEVTLELKLGLGLGLGLGFGLAAAGLASALAVLAALSFAVFASLFPAMTGAAVMASTSRLDNQLLTFNIDGVLLVPARLRPCHRTGGQRYVVFADGAVTAVTDQRDYRRLEYPARISGF
jgi:hypothetical protein